ncbi:hypothetical protein [Fodinibius salsisoli]|uniref:Thymidylate synthase n=1 Tax=Fodinibius salsisoli TaxID=2820877 RepID=A0ABT3PSK1_9BACT|nr:hypothetical protein [Fodinibius salsisoli]MCW9708845.1 hypothetical protein [Fodinibius salsisoli]
MRYKYVPSSGNLSIAWFKAFKHINKYGRTSPLIIRIKDIPKDISNLEDSSVRDIFDDFLNRKGQSSINTVANTIFPWSLWNPKKERKVLYKRHFRITPSIKSCNPNKFGHYFRRMIGFNTSYNDTKYSDDFINQIEHVIDTYRSGTHRHSALQIGIFDPDRDHSKSRQKGFPCLHQIAINSHGPNGKDGLGITGFYAKQLILKKAYGNYLGLCRLGYFLARELNMDFVQMNCVISEADINKSIFKKNDRDKLYKRINSLDIYNLHTI